MQLKGTLSCAHSRSFVILAAVDLILSPVGISVCCQNYVFHQNAGLIPIYFQDQDYRHQRHEFLPSMLELDHGLVEYNSEAQEGASQHEAQEGCSTAMRVGQLVESNLMETMLSSWIQKGRMYLHSVSSAEWKSGILSSQRLVSSTDDHIR